MNRYGTIIKVARTNGNGYDVQNHCVPSKKCEECPIRFNCLTSNDEIEISIKEWNRWFSWRIRQRKSGILETE